MNSLRAKINIMFVVFFIPLIVFSYYVNDYSIKVVKSQVADFNYNMLSSHIERYDIMLNETAGYLVNMAYQERALLKYLADPEHVGTVDYIINHGEIRKKFSDDLNYYGAISAFFIYFKETDEFILVERGRENRYGDVKAIIEAADDGQAAWEIMCTDNSSNIFKMVDIGFGAFGGAIFDIKDIINAIEISKGVDVSSTLVFEKNRGVIYNSSAVGDTISEIIAVPDSPSANYRSILDKDTGKKYIVINQLLKGADLNFSIIISEDKLLMNLPYFRFTILCIPFVFLVVLALYYFILYNTIHRPMNRLINSMESIEQGAETVKIEENYSGEFNYLIRTFNNMVSQIYELKVDIFDKEMKVKFAQLKQLQAQINPHFFMNTINLMQSLSVLKDYENIQKMACHLSDYFRFTMHNKEPAIVLTEELKHISNYLELQRIRFPNRMTFEFLIPECLETVKIPPLTLQPFVENSIIHGFENQKGGLFKILVEAEKHDSFAVIRISDNGRGFSNESLTSLQNRCFTNDESGDHFGVLNVYSRLDILFESKADISFDNAADGGAVVELKIPLE